MWHNIGLLLFPPMYFVIFLSFLSAVFFSYLLQRYSRSTPSFLRLKKTMNLHKHNLEEIVQIQNQKIQDSYLDYEMLLEQSKKMKTSLQAELEEYFQNVDRLRAEKGLVEELSRHLDNMASSTDSLSHDLGKLDLGMQEIAKADQVIQGIRSQLENLGESVAFESKNARQQLEKLIEELVQQNEGQMANMVTDAHSELIKLQEEQQDFGKQLESYKQQVTELEKHIETLPRNLSENYEKEYEMIEAKARGLEEKLEFSLKSKIDSLFTEISHVKKDFENNYNLLEQETQEKVEVMENSVKPRYEKLESNIKESIEGLSNRLDQIRKKAVTSLQDDIKNIQQEMADMNMETLSRRDELLNEVKQMAHKVKDQNHLFQETYLKAENKMQEEIQKYKKEIKEHVEEIISKTNNNVDTLLKNAQEDQSIYRDQANHEIDLFRTSLEKLEKEKTSFLIGDLEKMQGELQSCANKLSIELQKNFNELEGTHVHLNERLEKKIKEAKECSFNLEENTKEASDDLENLREKINTDIEENLNSNFEKMETSHSKKLDILNEKTTEYLSDIEKQAISFQEKIEVSKEDNREFLEEQVKQLATKLEERYENVEKYTQELISEQERAFQDLKEAANHVEEDLKKQLDLEKFVTEFEEISQSIIEEKKDILVDTVEKFSQEKEIAFQELEEYKEDFINLCEKEDTQIKEGKEKLEEYCQNMKKNLSFEVEKRFSELEEHNSQIDEKNFKVQKNLDNYLDKQEIVYKELEDAASNIEKDLTRRLKPEQWMERLEKESNIYLQKASKDLEAIHEKYNIEKDIFSNEINQIHRDLRKVESFYEDWEEQIGDLEEKQKNSSHSLEEFVKGIEKQSQEALENLQDKSATLEEGLEKQSQEALENLQDKSATLEEGLEKQSQEALENLQDKSSTLEEGLEKQSQEALENLQDKSSTLEEGLEKQSQETLENLQDKSAILGKEIETIAHKNIQDFENQTLSSLEELEQRKEQYKEEYKTTNLESLESIGENVESLKEEISKQWEDKLKITREKTDKFSEELEEKMIQTQSQFQEYIEAQETAYEELKLAANKIESDLRDRLQLDTYLENSEKKLEASFIEMETNLLSQLNVLEAKKEKIQEDISSCDKKLQSFEKNIECIYQVENFIDQLDESMETLDKRLVFLQKENKHIDVYAKNFEKLRLGRKEVESELRILENQKERLHEIERQLQEIYDKMNFLSDARQMAIGIEKRAEEFVIFKDTFDQYFGSIQDRKNYIEEALSQIEKSRNESLQANRQAQNVLENMDRTELRQTHLNNRLEQFEVRANHLEGMQEKAKDIESRFEQMDGLMIDLEMKQKQIASMSQRFDGIRLQGNNCLEELNSMFTEADEKMDKLSSFYQMIDTMVETRLQQSNEDLRLSTPRKFQKEIISEEKKDGILSLHLNHKWSPELIADRMKLELPLVKTIIQSHTSKA